MKQAGSAMYVPKTTSDSFIVPKFSAAVASMLRLLFQDNQNFVLCRTTCFEVYNLFCRELQKTSCSSTMWKTVGNLCVAFWERMCRINLFLTGTLAEFGLRSLFKTISTYSKCIGRRWFQRRCCWAWQYTVPTKSFASSDRVPGGGKLYAGCT